jgi:hypothetical protein
MEQASSRVRAGGGGYPRGGGRAGGRARGAGRRVLGCRGAGGRGAGVLGGGGRRATPCSPPAAADGGGAVPWLPRLAGTGSGADGGGGFCLLPRNSLGAVGGRAGGRMEALAPPAFAFRPSLGAAGAAGAAGGGGLANFPCCLAATWARLRLLPPAPSPRLCSCQARRDDDESSTVPWAATTCAASPPPPAHGELGHGGTSGCPSSAAQATRGRCLKVWPENANGAQPIPRANWIPLGPAPCHALAPIPSPGARFGDGALVTGRW